MGTLTDEDLLHLLGEAAGSFTIPADGPAEVVEEVVDFCLEVGLPVALEDIGVGDATRQDLERVAEAACAEGETIHNEPFAVYPEMVVDAMLAADAFGRQRRAVLEGVARLPAVAH